MAEPKEVDRWKGSPEWQMAELLHERLCRYGHQMDQCWGLNLPYDLNQPTLSSIQRRYLGLACALMEAFDNDQINVILTIMDDRWEPSPFPWGPSVGGQSMNLNELAEQLKMTKAKPKNYGMIQLTYRSPTDEEPLRSVTMYGIDIYTDADGNVVIVDVPAGFTSRLVGHDPEDLDKGV